MTKRSVTRPRGKPLAAAAASQATTITNAELDAIFASIRSGEAPWTLDQLPADTGATAVLLTELDRLWHNPLA